MTEKKDVKDIFPVTVLEIEEGDILNAIDCKFTEDVRDILLRVKWDAVLMKEIAQKVRERIYFDDYLDILARVIDETLKSEIEEMREKRSFVAGLKEFIKGNKKR